MVHNNEANEYIRSTDFIRQKKRVHLDLLQLETLTVVFKNINGT